MHFLFDACISRRLVTILRWVGHRNALHHCTQFDPDARDIDWLPHAAEAGWVLVTADTRMREDPAEGAALNGCRATVFISPSVSQKRLREQVLWYVRRWPDIEAVMHHAPDGAQFEADWYGRLKELG